MRKKLLLVALLIGLVAVLSGCMDLDAPINSSSTGIWNKYFVLPMSSVLIFFAGLFKGDFGLSIVVVTLIVRLILLPLNVKQIRSSKAMQDIQPQIKELQAQHSSKDSATQQKLQQETMALFQKNGVNPLAGCLPIFVQMPVLIAMYHAIMRTQEIEGNTFLWFELDSPDKILPILAGLATFAQQKIMMSGNAQQNPTMTAMLYLMPIMITIFAFFFPAALALYWVVGNTFMVAQTLLIRGPMLKGASTGGDKK